MCDALRLKKDHKQACLTQDFWYDLSSGGYIDPHDFLEPEDAKLVDDAVSTLLKFQSLLEHEGILDFY